MKAGLLLNVVQLDQSGLSVSPDRLMDFALAASAPFLSVELWAKGDHRQIRLEREFLMPVKTDPLDNTAAVVAGLLNQAGSTHEVPVVLHGEAARKYVLE